MIKKFLLFGLLLIFSIEGLAQGKADVAAADDRDARLVALDRLAQVGWLHDRGPVARKWSRHQATVRRIPSSRLTCAVKPRTLAAWAVSGTRRRVSSNPRG